VIESIRETFRKNARARAPVDVNDLVDETVALLQDELNSHQIVLQVERGAHLPRVMGDRIQLQQVLLNLMTNAIEAMAAVEGPYVLAMSSNVRDDGGVMISIADTGTGIGAEDAQRVFNPLFTTKSSGMGMGLSICRSIIEAHDGTLWVVPNVPRGSIFQFVLGANTTTPAAV
jgi:signal transduction histidine kinase